MTRATILAVLLFVGTGGLIARPQLALKGLKVADVFAAMSGPREDFERFMTAVDEALMADPSNAGARLLHGVGLARRSLDAIQNNDGKAAGEFWAASLQELDRVDLDTVSHFYAKEGLTFAATGSRDVVVDAPIADLERRLDPADFLRIHRGTLVNVRFIAEAHAGFAGGMALRLKDAKRTSLQVARDRVREVKDRLGF
jgi:DNA-binding LytR/AlgR family response regulator